jgi:prepilin-type N-terminal cleavage/methylation domain-containing protein
MKSGFSLIELLVVVAIIAMLVGVATPYFTDYLKESKISKAKADLDILKQAVILYNAREDQPYRGVIATFPPFVPILGETDFLGLQGRFLTNIPADPWGKNYKLDPYGCFVYSDGPDSNTHFDDLKEYYVKELALSRVEWLDVNNSRTMDSPDKLYFHFNKPLWVEGGMMPSDFDVYENNIMQDAASATLLFSYVQTYPNPPAYDLATSTVLEAIVDAGNSVKVGVHAIALKDEQGVAGILSRYREVVADRPRCSSTDVRTEIELVGGNPLRFAIRTSPIKIVPKN